MVGGETEFNRFLVYEGGLESHLPPARGWIDLNGSTISGVQLVVLALSVVSVGRWC